jgi:hypothetical protein
MKLLILILSCLFFQSAFAIIELIDIDKLTISQKKVWEKELKSSPWSKHDKGYGIFSPELIVDNKVPAQRIWRKVLVTQPIVYPGFQNEILGHLKTMQASLHTKTEITMTDLNTLFVLAMNSQILEEMLTADNQLGLEKKELLQAEFQVTLAKIDSFEKRKVVDSFTNAFSRFSLGRLYKAKRNLYNKAQVKLAEVIRNYNKVYTKLSNNAWERNFKVSVFVSNIEDGDTKMNILINQNIFNVDNDLISEENNIFKNSLASNTEEDLIQKLNIFAQEMEQGAVFDAEKSKEYSKIEFVFGSSHSGTKNQVLKDAYYKAMAYVVIAQLELKPKMFEVTADDQEKINAGIKEIREFILTLP